MRKILIALVLVSALSVAAGASGRSSPGTTAARSASCAKADLELVTAGTLTIGTDNPAYPPWFGGGEIKGSKWKINDPTTGKGYESAVAYEVAKRLGFTKAEVGWVVVPFSRSFAPGKKPFDFFVNQVSVTPQRAKNVGFSTSYYNVNQAVVGLKGKPIASVKTLAGLKRFKLGAPIGTTSYDYIVKHIKSPDPAVYDTLNDAVTALKNGQIDGLVVDFPSTGYITAVQVPKGVVVGRLPTKGVPEIFGLVFQKGSPLVACVNQVLAKMRADGTLKRLEVRWLAQAGGAPILK
jgi:polar amino acid transport system substrate-binding protein